MTGAVGFVSLLFFLCGFSSVLIAILVPLTTELFQLSYTEASLLFFSLYLAYFFISPLAGFLFRQREVAGMQWGIVLGVFGLSLMSMNGSLPLFFAGVFLLGSGIAAIQVTANPYVVFLAQTRQSQRLAFTQTFTSLGMITAPLFASATFLSDHKITFPFLLLASLWGVASLLCFFLPLPKRNKKNEAVKPIFPLERPVIAGMAGIALAVGIEVATGTYLVPLLMQPDTFNIPIDTAGEYSALFWMGIFAGRLFSSALLSRVSPVKLLTGHTLLGGVLSLVAAYSTGWTAALCALSLGVCISVLFPIVFSWTLANTRSDPTRVSSLLCMANLGGAFIPMAQGAVIDRFDVHLSYLVPAACFILLMTILRKESSCVESDALHASG